jgi:hypothetical protein
MFGQSKNVSSMEKQALSDTESVVTLILGFPISRTIRNELLLYVSYTAYAVL